MAVFRLFTNASYITLNNIGRGRKYIGDQIFVVDYLVIQSAIDTYLVDCLFEKDGAKQKYERNA